VLGPLRTFAPMLMVNCAALVVGVSVVLGNAEAVGANVVGAAVGVIVSGATVTVGRTMMGITTGVFVADSLGVGEGAQPVSPTNSPNTPSAARRMGNARGFEPDGDEAGIYLMVTATLADNRSQPT
jgi:hypothetical protein